MSRRPSLASSAHDGARLAGATVAVGVLAGLSGTALTLLLHLVQHLAFGYSEQSFLIGVERASPLRRVLAPAIGGVLVGMLWWWHRRRIVADDVSVTYALREQLSRLPVRHTVFDAVIQLIAVGAGASLGREGAPRQAGAALAGWVARLLGVPSEQRRVLLAAGAGAGLAAVYNVPVAGALFTVEILLASLAPAGLLVALLCSAVATVVAWPVLGDRPVYEIAPLHGSWPLLVGSMFVGPLCGVLGVGFVRATTWARRHAPRGARAAIAIPAAFTVLGLAAIAFPTLLGNGKGPAGLAFDAHLSVGLALTLVILKPLATVLCLRSGAIGGLITPALATGAVLGLAVARPWSDLWPGSASAAYAAVAATALVAVTQRAPLTAVALTIELLGTGQAIVVPIGVAVLLAFCCARLVDRSILWPLHVHLAALWHAGRCASGGSRDRVETS